MDRKSHNHRFCCTAQFVAALLLAGCGTVEVFGKYDLPENAGTADAPYPKLVDTPTAPPLGTYTATVPDPARGAAAQAVLSLEADAAAERAQAIKPEVITQAERDRILKDVERRRQKLRAIDTSPAS